MRRCPQRAELCRPTIHHGQHVRTGVHPPGPVIGRGSIQRIDAINTNAIIMNAKIGTVLKLLQVLTEQTASG